MELQKKYLPNYTYDDYEQWEGKWELINGIPFAMSPAPGIAHQEVSGKIHYQLLNLLKNCNNCKALLAIDWRPMDEFDNNVFQPDNLVICKEATGNYITDAPELIFELLSPATALKDKHLKFEAYEARGVKYYVIVDIDLRAADVFELKDGKYSKIIEAKNDIVNFILDNNCVIDFNFSEIWV